MLYLFHDITRQRYPGLSAVLCYIYSMILSRQRYPGLSAVLCYIYSMILLSRQRYPGLSGGRLGGEDKLLPVSGDGVRAGASRPRAFHHCILHRSVHGGNRVYRGTHR